GVQQVRPALREIVRLGDRLPHHGDSSGPVPGRSRGARIRDAGHSGTGDRRRSNRDRTPGPASEDPLARPLSRRPVFRWRRPVKNTRTIVGLLVVTAVAPSCLGGGGGSPSKLVAQPIPRWQTQQRVPTTSNLRTVNFANLATGLIGGQDGTIFWTDDAGTT